MPDARPRVVLDYLDAGHARISHVRSRSLLARPGMTRLRAKNMNVRQRREEGGGERDARGDSDKMGARVHKIICNLAFKLRMSCYKRVSASSSISAQT